MHCAVQTLLQQYIIKYGSGQPMSTFSHLSVQEILGLQAAGAPGNGVCELGELPTLANTGAPRDIQHSMCGFVGTLACMYNSDAATPS